MWGKARRLLDDTEDAVVRRKVDYLSNSAVTLDSLAAKGRLEDALDIVGKGIEFITDIDSLLDSLTTNTNKKPTKSQKPKRKNITPRQLLIEAREKQIWKLMKKDESNRNCRKLGGILKCDPSTIARSKSWKNRADLGYPKPPKGTKKNIGEKGPDIEATAESPQPEHYDIHQMIQEHKEGKIEKPPTIEEIAQKLSTPEEPVSVEQAKILFRQTQNFFPDLLS